MMKMNYNEGIRYMQELTEKLEEGEKKCFSVGDLTINYPGRKKIGDYQLTTNGVPPKHTDIIDEIYTLTTFENIDTVITCLDDIYKNGTNATAVEHISKELIEKIYWITLQEEINYPQPTFKGRKLPFQRFYEAALVKVEKKQLGEIKSRTNNHGQSTPELYTVNKYRKPSFYQ